MATVVAGVTFVAGVQRLQETPRLVGWNWDLSVSTEDRADDLVQYLLASPRWRGPRRGRSGAQA